MKSRYIPRWKRRGTSIALLLITLGLPRSVWSQEESSQGQNTAPSESNTFNGLGIANASQSEYPKAVVFDERALASAREVGDRKRERVELNKLADAYRAIGQYSRALTFYEGALAIAHQARGGVAEAKVLNTLGFVHRAMSNYAVAISLYEKALAIERRIGDGAGEAATLSNLGLAYRSLGQHTKAVALYEQALKIQRAIGAGAGEGATLNNLGLLYDSLGEHSKAIRFYTRALAITRNVPDLAGEGIIVNNLAGAYRSLGQHARAVDYYEQALAIAREAGHRRSEGTILTNLGWAHSSLRQYSEAVGFYQQALPVRREVGDRAGEAATLNSWMETMASQKKHQLAVLFGKQAVNVYQQIRQGLVGLDNGTRTAYLESHEGTYRRLADLLLEQDRIAEAQQVLNLLKEEEFFEFVRRDSGHTASLAGRTELTPAEAEWDRRYNEIAGRLTEIGYERGKLLGLPTRTSEQVARLASLGRDLKLAGEAFHKFLARLDADTSRRDLSKETLAQVKDSQVLMEVVRELSSETGSNTVAMYTLVADDKLRLILITADVMKATEIEVKRIDLNAKIVAFREKLHNRRSDPKQLAQELYRLILGPMERDLAGAGAQTLMWSLDGALRYLPVAALHDGEHYLIERFRNVVFTPASNANLKDAPAVQWRALGLGVSQKHPGFRALPGAQKELEGIIRDEETGRRGVLPGVIRLDGRFTEQSMVAELENRYPVVHIASHFLFKPGNETDSYLLLGDGDHMTMAALGKMLNPFGGVDLLTLSACDTATGGTANGKEVEGFAVLAQQNGAKAVIATLWPVADASTNELMQAFYRIRESKPGTTKAEALQRAQLSLLQGNVNYNHPYYWAPFILIGNSR